MLIDAVAFYFADQRFCTLTQCGTANFRDSFTFAYGFMADYAVGRTVF